MKARTRNVVCLSLLACAGCGGGLDGIEVSGMVTSAGQPVKEATIRFKPPKGTQGPTVNGRIVDGRYQIPASDGLQAGRYVVQVVVPVQPEKKKMMQNPANRIPKANEPPLFEREIVGPSAQVDLQL